MTEPKTNERYVYDQLSPAAQLTAESFDPRPKNSTNETRATIDRYLRNRIHSIYPVTPELHYTINTPDDTDRLTFTALFALHDLLPRGAWIKAAGEPILPNLNAYPTLKQLYKEDNNTSETLELYLQINEAYDPTTQTVTTWGKYGTLHEEHPEIKALEQHVLNYMQEHAKTLIREVKTMTTIPLKSESVAEWHRQNHTPFTKDGTPLEPEGTESLYTHMSAHPDVKAGRALFITWEIHDILELEGPDGRYPLTEEDAIKILSEVERNYDASVGINWETLEDAITAYLDGKNLMLTGEVAIGRQHSSSEAGGWDTIEVQLPSSDLEGLTELQVAAAFERAAADELEARNEPCVFLKLLSYNAGNGI